MSTTGVLIRDQHGKTYIIPKQEMAQYEIHDPNQKKLAATLSEGKLTASDAAKVVAHGAWEVPIELVKRMGIVTW